MELRTRRATEDDALRVKELEMECGLSPWRVEDYAAEALRNESVFLVATCPDESEGVDIAAFLIMRLITRAISSQGQQENSFDAEILNLAVSPYVRRKGVGAALFTAGIREPGRAKIRNVFLEVRRSNLDAQGFYSAAGFVVSGERKRFYSGPTEDALLLTASADKVLARFPGNSLVFEL